MQAIDSPSSILFGLNFLLSHLAKPEFPRTIATKFTEGKQIVVATKEEALLHYKQANYNDCRLAAYPYIVDNRPQIIDFVMIDLDLNNFKYSIQKLNKALKKILLILLKDNNIEPTVIWSGNGYHVLVPLIPLQSTLEEMAEFAKFKEPSKYILRFLEKHLSGGKSDSVHNNTVSCGNCMLRVPYSINAKRNCTQVSIIKKWNGQKFNIKPLLGDFIAYMLDKADEIKRRNYNSYNYGNLLSRA